MKVAGEILDSVGNVARSFDRKRINAVLDHRRFEWRAFDERLPDNGIAPGDNLAVFESAAQTMDKHRTVITAANVILACPH